MKINMENKKISLDERKKIQLIMLKEIDEFCRKRDIRYSLSSGTLIGAIRHKGFIPWDDDLDITMPLPDMIRFKNEFQSEDIKFCDIDTEEYYFFPFPRLAYIPTYSLIGERKGPGVCIDLYVVVGISEDTEDQKTYFNRAMALYEKRIRYKKLLSAISHIYPISTLPGMDNCIREFRDHLCNTNVPYDKAKVFYRIASAQKPKLIKKNTLTFDFFDTLLDLPFENQKCKCTGHYDEYLSQRYGDYMQLPPEEDRHPYHNSNYYWK